MQVSSRQKETSSTAGMQDSVRTSSLLKFRAQVWIPSYLSKYSIVLNVIFPSLCSTPRTQSSADQQIKSVVYLKLKLKPTRNLKSEEKPYKSILLVPVKRFSHSLNPYVSINGTFIFGYCFLQEVVPKRIDQMERAIKSRDFEEFAKITCADSNQFHATCLDTSPPIFYLNDVSRRWMSLVSFKDLIQSLLLF